METLLAIIFIVFGVLQIIFFIKMWGMTNDVKDIRNKYLQSETTNVSLHYENTQNHQHTKQTALQNDIADIPIDTLVVELKTEKQMRVKEKLANGKYRCYSEGIYAGDYAPSEFMMFDQWVKEVYRK